jgi:predicted flap endonuclease-1-like 5' DNA nuclease
MQHHRRCVAAQDREKELVMALSREFPGVPVVPERTEHALRLPMGVTSPLWAVFGAAAGVGVAYWWMTSWTRLVNVEALAGLTAKTPVAPVAEPASVAVVAEPAAKVVEDVAEVVEAAVAAPVEIVEAVAAALPDDDLTRMTGIGPKLAAALATRGVTRFAQIAAWTVDDLAEADVALALKGRAVREAWVAQAKRLAASA